MEKGKSKNCQRAVRKRRKKGKNVLKTVRCESGDMWSRVMAQLATLVSRKKETKKKPQRRGRDAQDVPSHLEMPVVQDPESGLGIAIGQAVVVLELHGRVR